jgi:hypothetical protein
VITLP